jgi:hypothetical protein
MVLKESTTTKLTISDLPNLDPINVFFEDYGPQRGKVTIEVCGDSWSYFWGAMGEGYTVKSFFLKTGTDYLVGKLKIGIKPTIDDDSQGALQRKCRKTILYNRKEKELTKEEAAEQWGYVDEIWGDGFSGDEKYLEAILGSEWYNMLPQIPNPEYQYLCRIVNTIKEALKHEN